MGYTETLTATVMPDDATYKNVTWTSSNENVATVNKNGKVTAVGAGEADITVTATNGTEDVNDDYSAICKVTVKKDASATYAQEGEDFTSETETDNIASLWSVEVTPGDDAITSLGVKVTVKSFQSESVLTDSAVPTVVEQATKAANNIADSKKTFTVTW